MSGSSLHLASTNTTTIENLSRRSKVWTLAIYISPEQFQRLSSSNTDGQWARTFPMVTFPIPQSTTTTTTPSTPAVAQPESRPETEHIVSDNSPKDNSKNSQNIRTFALLRTQPGENPFDLGDPIQNLRQVMGHTLWDWMLPLRVAPCVDHSSTVSAYPMGPVVDRLKREAGLDFTDCDDRGSHTEGRNGQAPDNKEDNNSNDNKHRRKRGYHRRRQNSTTPTEKTDDDQMRGEQVVAQN